MSKMIKEKLFGNLDFNSIVDNPDFKEDSVREVIILPILKEMGYTNETIVRSKSLQHPILKIGSKKRPITLIPDYCLKVQDNYAWVLDAKAPNQKIVNNDNVEQVYSYAFHPEIRSVYFALCNGIEFSIFKTNDPNQAILFFQLNEIDEYWESLNLILSSDSFQIGKKVTYESINTNVKSDWDYPTRPLLEEISVKKRAAKRHFGVHGYFTKQTWNVVAEYIKNFSKEGDLVLDPFGGSGVTAVEALMNNRHGISIDINPLACFMVKSLVEPVNTTLLYDIYLEIKAEYLQNEPKTKDEIAKAIKKYKGPKSLSLPKGSDVDTSDKLFNEKQTAQLSLLKSIILKQKDKNIRETLLLMFSGLVTKVNLTYHTSTYVEKEGGGNASAFQYYRYRIAPNPVEVDIIKYFELRYKKVSDAKWEMEHRINEKSISNIQVIKGSATDLSFFA